MSTQNRKTPACGAFRRPAIQLVNEPRSLCARRRKENPIIFFGDMCGKKILLGLQTCAPSASGGQRVRCGQAANFFVKK